MLQSVYWVLCCIALRYVFFYYVVLQMFTFAYIWQKLILAHFIFFYKSFFSYLYQSGHTHTIWNLINVFYYTYILSITFIIRILSPVKEKSRKKSLLADNNLENNDVSSIIKSTLQFLMFASLFNFIEK